MITVALLAICFEGDDVICFLCFCEEKHYFRQALRSAEKSFKEIDLPSIRDNH